MIIVKILQKKARYVECHLGKLTQGTEVLLVDNG